ncbi:Mob1/phocein family protein [Trichomonas vaginalis G3]|uniref:Mob1/phocein family protein n=1 Tax=Trichomonas vaginalis (strain ATCC PRA-98 / G3) TaxID=412133 RepID=A2E465_TRIV3|nr:hippo signaling [Trichomonas vaginalis G3]EAY12511.1 Mob1/phocein family protein [Trichomonas vaginalis G3]KAI5554048.1 hippo signaling [Trichomonas vaginalis G3]|eukprot:XP_001324734.1 Mob1/phocein family protein [Trichomonas vaginalis G3]
MNWFNIGGNRQTFRPVRRGGINQRRTNLHQHQMETLGYGDFHEAVKLPEGEDLNEWLANGVVDFCNQLEILYRTITEFCTPETCPVMSAGQGFKYLWSDNNQYQRPTEVSAPEYISLLLDWVKDQIYNEDIFPTAQGKPFPDNFQQVIKNIMKRLFRIYAHCYWHHIDNFKTLGTDSHLNTSFKYFMCFTLEFNLIPPDQLEPLHDRIESITRS